VGYNPGVPLYRHVAENGVVAYLSPQLRAAGVGHAFSTRLGGVSRAPFDTLNLGNPNGSDVQDPADNISQNYSRLLDAADLAGCQRHWTWQVHGAAVAVVGPDRFDNSCQADALVTVEAGRALSVRSADCCPVLLATADGRAVAAAHAGWRGAVAGVAAAAVAELCRAAGAAAGEVIAAVGPCIGFDAFEVGPEVLDAFADRFGTDTVRRDGPGGKGHANLPEAVRRSLVSAGVPADRIDTTDRCSVRDGDEFFSHRREHVITGRMAAVIAVAKRSNTETRRHGESKAEKAEDGQR
jgi:YfiH family protein